MKNRNWGIPTREDRELGGKVCYHWTDKRTPYLHSLGLLCMLAFALTVAACSMWGL